MISIILKNLAVGCQDLVCFTSNNILVGLIGNYTSRSLNIMVVLVARMCLDNGYLVSFDEFTFSSLLLMFLVKIFRLDKFT